MERYSIKDLEKLSGIKAHTIRVWERRYKIIEPSRTGTNRRRYDDIQLRKIINISILQQNGFKISLIAALSDRQIEEKVSYLSKDTNQSETQINTLTKLTVDLDEKGINDLLIRTIMNRGLEETFTEIVFPFLKRIGIMWQTGSADVASEHFVATIFRNRIILAIESLPPAVRHKGKRIILFLPENELHEIGLLFFNYILRKLGHETLYLGQSAPLKSVITLINRWNADIIVTGLMSGYPDIDADDYLLQLSGSFPDKKVLVFGIFAETAEKIKLSDVFPVKSADDLKSHLQQ